MSQPKTVGVKELKNRLSAYLREVRRGRRVLVTDRGRVVAELRQASPLEDSREAAMTEWLEGGQVRPPAREKERLPAPPVRLPSGTGQEILDELRGGDPRGRPE